MTNEYYIVTITENDKMRYIADSNIGLRLTNNLMNDVDFFNSKESAEFVLKQWKESWSNSRINWDEAIIRKVTITIE